MRRAVNEYLAQSPAAGLLVGEGGVKVALGDQAARKQPLSEASPAASPLIGVNAAY